MSDFLAEMEARKTRAPKRDTPVAAIVGAFSLALGAPIAIAWLLTKAAAKLVSGQAAPAEMAQHGGTFLGIALAVGVGLWAVLHFGFVRQTRPDWGGRMLGGLVGLALASMAVSAFFIGSSADQLNQQQIAAAEIRKVFSLFISDSLEGEMTSTAVKARGRAGRVERKMKADMARAIAMAEQYRTEIGALDLEKTMIATASQADLKTYAERLAKARTLTAAYRLAIRKQLVAVRVDFEQGGFEPWFKKTYLPEFEQQYRQKQGRFDKSLGQMEEYYSLREQRMLALYNSYGRWTQRGYMTVFNRQADLRIVEGLANRLRYVTWKMDVDAAADREAVLDFEYRLEAAGLKP